jgi:hypothetical protein
VKHRILVVWTLVSSSLIMQVAGRPASIVASPTAPFPATGEEVCEQAYLGTYEAAPGSRTCTVVAPGIGTVVYAGFGSGGFDWVQTTRYGLPDEATGVQLGPASVGCARPAGTAGNDWAAACM